MKKIFISVAMNGREEYEIHDDIVNLKFLGKAYFGNDIEFVDNRDFERIFPEGINERVWCLGEAIKKLAACDAMISFDNELTNRAKGCQIEREVCYNYGIPVLRIEDWCFRNRVKNTEEVPVCEGC
mgnify:CR=1 FL=1